MSGFLDLIGNVLDRQNRLVEVPPVIVHCRSGSTEAALFCAICLLLERLRSEKMIDVFSTVSAGGKCELGGGAERLKSIIAHMHVCLVLADLHIQVKTLQLQRPQLFTKSVSFIQTADASSVKICRSNIRLSTTRWPNI